MGGAGKAAASGSPSFSELLALAHALADVSAAVILPHFRSDELSIDNKAVSRAGGFDPVTAADRAGEVAIRARLAAAFPTHGILGEEIEDEAAASSRDPHRWIIDPIDGTRAFIMGVPLWGTLIGLTRAGAPLLGLMNQPYTGERFWSSERESWSCGPLGERKLRTRACRALEDAILTATHPDLFAAGFEQERFAALKARARMTRYGGDCYSYCMLAAGHVDLVVEAGLKPYDVAALAPIIERAGGRMTGWDGSAAIGSSRIVAAGDPRLHEAVLGMLNG